MRYKCDLCGVIDILRFDFMYREPIGYKLEFCFDCGSKIQKKIDELREVDPK